MRRKRRGSHTHQRYEFGYLILSPELHEALVPAGNSGIRRSAASLTPAAIGTLRELSRQGVSLRAIATVVGVSHETVRKTLFAT
jgi:hypothetical protein